MPGLVTVPMETRPAPVPRLVVPPVWLSVTAETPAPSTLRPLTAPVTPVPMLRVPPSVLMVRTPIPPAAKIDVGRRDGHRVGAAGCGDVDRSRASVAGEIGNIDGQATIIGVERVEIYTGIAAAIGDTNAVEVNAADTRCEGHEIERGAAVGRDRFRAGIVDADRAGIGAEAGAGGGGDLQAAGEAGGRGRIAVGLAHARWTCRR